jgi:hypothetical protein
MDAKQRNTALVAAIIAGVLSLPMTWMTIHNAQATLNGPFPGGAAIFGSMFGPMTLDVSGLNGSVTLLVKAPLWFVICVAISSSVMQLMANSKAFAIPPIAAWGTAVLGVVWMSVPIALALFTGRITPGIGWLLGLLCAITPLACLMMTQSASQNTIPGNPGGPSETRFDFEPPQN